MLFYVTPVKKSLVPVTTVKAITGTHVILLSGERVPDTNPKFEDRYGTETSELGAIYNTLKSVVEENAKSQQEIARMRTQVAAELKSMKKQINDTLADTIQEAKELQRTCREAVQNSSETISLARNATGIITQAGDILYESIQQLQKDVAASQTL